MVFILSYYYLRSGWKPALRNEAPQSTRGGWLHVLRRLFWCFDFWLHLYADSPFTYAIRPECSAGLMGYPIETTKQSHHWHQEIRRRVEN